MRRNYEQACMDTKNMNGEDTIDLLLKMPKLPGRVWKYLFDLRDLDNQVATTQKEISAALTVHTPNISKALGWLIEHEDIQRDGIHYYINPYRWWFGDDGRKHHARDRWDDNKLQEEVNGTNNNK